MKSIFRLLMLLFCVSLLSGCTLFLWYKQPEAEIVADDKLSAIGKIQKEGEERLMLFGEEYWLLLDKDSSDTLAPFFTTKFSQPFSFGAADDSFKFTVKAKHLSAPTPYIYIFSKKGIAIELTGDKQKQFLGNVSLSYKNATAEEAEVLKSFCHNNREWWRCNLAFRGEIYQKGEETLNLQDYKVEPAVPITVFYETTNRSLGEISRNVILTPFTLVGDIVIILPLLAIDEMVR